MHITGRRRLGPVEWGVLAGIAVLIGAEAAAVVGGLGPVAAVVVLGYLVVLGVAYWMYRQARSSRSYQAQPAGVAAYDSPQPDVLPIRLSDVDLFRELSDKQIDSVAALGQPLLISGGEVLGVAGEQGNQLFIILEGKAELSARSGVGEITVRVAEPGESFPLAVLLGDGTLITTAKAMTDMELLVISRSRLLALCAREPEIGMKIYAAVATVLAKRYSRTLAHLTSSAEMVLKETGFFANI